MGDLTSFKLETVKLNKSSKYSFVDLMLVRHQKNAKSLLVINK